MSVGRTEYAMARKKWDLSTIFGIPKSCLQPQYPRNLCKNNLIGGSKFLAAKMYSLVTTDGNACIAVPSDITSKLQHQGFFFRSFKIKFYSP